MTKSYWGEMFFGHLLPKNGLQSRVLNTALDLGLKKVTWRKKRGLLGDTIYFRFEGEPDSIMQFIDFVNRFKKEHG